MDALDRLIQAAFDTGKVPAVVRMYMRDAMSNRTEEPFSVRLQIALTAIEGRGMVQTEREIRALISTNEKEEKKNE